VKSTADAHHAKWAGASIVVGAMFFLCLYFVVSFGVNVPFWDEWELLERFRNIWSGQTTWWSLAASKHNEHLIGFAFLMQVLQLLLSDYNTKALLVTGVLIQALSSMVLVLIGWRSVPDGRRPLWLALSALILFSLSQHKNLLWGFQTAWFLVTLLLALTLAFLQKAKDAEGHDSFAKWFSLGTVTAMLAIFTSTQGVIVWLAVAVYLFARENYRVGDFFRSRTARLWVVASVVAGVVFVSAWLLKGGGGAAGGVNPLSLRTVAYIFVGLHGAFLGDIGKWGVLCFGAVLLAFVGAALLKAFSAEDKGGYALPVALMAFGLAFALLVAIGRAKYSGIGAARDPHYTAYSLLTFFGALTALLRRETAEPTGARRMFVLGTVLFPAAVVVATFSSTYDAVLKGLEWREQQGSNAATLLKYRDQETPDFALALLFGDVAMVRRNAEFLEANRLGVFGDSKAVSDIAKTYAEAPPSWTAYLAKYPQYKGGLMRAWWVYRSGGDLRRAFNPLSPEFGRQFLAWCHSAASSGDHYLSAYLKDYASDFEAILKAESAGRLTK
jgi:hypothetical protein